MLVRDILAYDSWGSLNNYNDFKVIVQLIKIKKNNNCYIENCSPTCIYCIWLSET